MRRLLCALFTGLVALVISPGVAGALAPLFVTITTVATPGPVPVGTPIQDTATVTAGAIPGPAPTGEVTFQLFGPDNLTCTGAPVFTSTRPLVGGPPPTATSESFAPVAPGSYYWVATYSGDANYLPAVTTCGDPTEISVVYPLAVAGPHLATAAAPPAPPVAVASSGGAGIPPSMVGVVAGALLVQVALGAGALRRRRLSG